MKNVLHKATLFNLTIKLKVATVTDTSALHWTATLKLYRWTTRTLILTGSKKKRMTASKVDRFS